MSKEPIKTRSIIAQNDCHLSGAKNEELRLFPWLRELLPKFRGLKSFNSLCRFCKKPFLQNSNSIPISSLTRRQECKGVQLSNLLSEYGIFVHDDLSLSSRSSPKCAKHILASCRALQEVKQAAQAEPSPGNPSVKGLA